MIKYIAFLFCFSLNIYSVFSSSLNISLEQHAFNALFNPKDWPKHKEQVNKLLLNKDNSININILFKGRVIKDLDFSNMHLQNVDFEGSTLDNVNLENVDFEGAKFNNVTFNNIKFENINLSGIGFNECKFNNISFIDIDLSETEFTNSTLEIYSWEKTIGKDVLTNKEILLRDPNKIPARKIIKCECKNDDTVDLFSCSEHLALVKKYSDLTKKMKSNLDLSFSLNKKINSLNKLISLLRINLRSKDLTGFDLTNINLQNSILENANLTDTILHNANLKKAWVGGVRLTKNIRIPELSRENYTEIIDCLIEEIQDKNIENCKEIKSNYERMINCMFDEPINELLLLKINHNEYIFDFIFDLIKEYEESNLSVLDIIYILSCVKDSINIKGIAEDCFKIQCEKIIKAYAS